MATCVRTVITTTNTKSSMTGAVQTPVRSSSAPKAMGRKNRPDRRLAEAHHEALNHRQGHENPRAQQEIEGDRRVDALHRVARLQNFAKPSPLIDDTTT